MPHLMWTTDRLLMKPSANGIRHWSELVTSRRTEKDFFNLWYAIDFKCVIEELTKRSLRGRIYSVVMRAIGAFFGTKGKKIIKKLLGR